MAHTSQKAYKQKRNKEKHEKRISNHKELKLLKTEKRCKK